MPTPQEALTQEALSAIKEGNRARARDLLTRLIKMEPQNAEHWVWMSAVVDTPKERIYCLKEALKLDPQNASARRGLTVLGVLPPDPSMSLPRRYQQRNWQARQAPDDTHKKPVPKTQQILFGSALLGLVILIVVVAVFGVSRMNNRWRRGVYIPGPTETAVIVQVKTPTDTPTPEGTPLPLSALLKATYTPTPLYVNTPHPRYEDYRIGMMAYHRGDWASAERHLKQVATYEPVEDVLYHLGEIYRQQGEYEKALNAYNQALTLQPNFAPAIFGRALLYDLQNPDSVQEAIADLETAIELDPALGQAYLELAVLQAHVGEAEAALETLDQAESVTPGSPLVYLYRAKIYQSMGDTAKMLENARKANQLDITMLSAYRLIGEALQADGNFKGSIEPLETYITYEEADATAWVLLANAYLNEGEPEKSLNALDQALEIDNGLLDAYLQRARLYLEQDKPEKALEDYQTCVRLDKTSFDASLGVGMALLAMDYPGDAYMQFERTQGLAKEEKQKAELLYWRGLSLEALGEVQAAINNWKKLLEIPEENVSEAWIEHAESRIKALVTATPTERPKSPTPKPSSTSTRWPTQTPTATVTPKSASKTPTPSKTP